jgi:hypothetical protein
VDYDISPQKKVKFINFKALARALQYEIKQGQRKAWSIPLPKN